MNTNNTADQTKTNDTAEGQQPNAGQPTPEQQKSRFWKIGRTAAYITGGVVVVGAAAAAIWAFSRGKAEVVEAVVDAAA